MLEIFKPELLEGKKFFRPGLANPERFICIGVGQNPDGSNYAIGALWDAQRQTTVIRTELFKNIEFEGDITGAFLAP